MVNSSHEKPGWGRWAAWLGLNFCLSAAVGSIFLSFTGGHPAELLFAALALFSNTVMLYAVLGGLFAGLFLFRPGRPLMFALAAFFQLALVTDLAVYKIFRFHLNSMVLNLLLTPGGLDSLDQGPGMKALFLAIAASLGAAQWYFWRLAGRLAPGLTARRVKLAAALALLCVAADKGLFAWGTLYDSVYITRNAQLFPLYQPLKVRGFAKKYFGFKLDAEIKGGVDSRYSALAYPLVPLEVKKPAKPLNFLVLVVDSLRGDMLTPDVMPETWAFSARGLRFANHHSGGNSTRFGIFTLVYGLYGNYWFPMVNERRGPALVDVLKEQGYDLRLYASAKLSFPEFDKTCFARVPREGIYDEPPGADGAEKDRNISERLREYIRSRDKKRPYFAFVFYDATHGSYDYAPGFEKFKPSHGVSLLKLDKKGSLPMFNKYKNSVHYDDSLVGGILKTLAEAGGLEDTVVVITGDHGEPFYERGFYGHNREYSPEDIRVPLVLYRPGLKPGVSREATSHLDVAPELLALAGVKNPASDYSGGRRLTETGPRPFIPAFSWDTAALIRPDRTLVMPLAAYKGGLRVYDSEYRELHPSEAASFSGDILSFQKEARRFLK